MTTMYIIYDEHHAEFISEKFDTLESAIMELRRISETPFGAEPNSPPCHGWENCKRIYHIHEYDDAQLPWVLLSNVKALQISASEIKWYIK